MIRRWPFIVLILAWLLGACGADYIFRGNLIDAPQPAPDFTLTDQHGQPFRMSEQQGKVVVMFFGFTSCPDICPTTLADVNAALQQMGTAADDVQVVFVTVDPERDTPDQLGKYLALFDPAFIGLHGQPDELSSVLSAYGAAAFRKELPNSAMGYTMDHTAAVYVIDKQGRWRELFDYGTPVDDMASDLTQLVQGN